ncbi:MAG: Rieske (2Fe-2S) protein [Actinomycetota bacterium]|nr:Rieske (2Fe-2S) protein [Actinomycetota bacterium]
MPTSRRPVAGNRLHAVMRRVERARGLDGLAERVARVTAAVTQRPSGAGDVLSGTWLGHAAHPMLTDFADGAWIGASFLDLFGPRGSAPAARRLVGLGLLAAVPTSLTGFAEWAGTRGKERRVGLLHAGTSTLAVALYGCSYLARRRGKGLVGVALGTAGGVVAYADGYVGGHLSLALGVGVGRNAFEPLPHEWSPTLALDELSEERPVQAVLSGTAIVLVLRGDHVFALADRCSYRGAPLHRGSVSGGAIVCPEHGCTFDLEDGAVLGGPASIPQPWLEARVREGRVELRAPALTEGR